MPICCARRSPMRATTTASAPTRHRRRSCRIFLGSQLEDVIHQIEKGPASESKDGGDLDLGVRVTAGPAARRDGPQPDVSFCLHGQQVRIPRGRVHRRPSTGRRPCSTQPSPTRSASSPTSSTSSSPRTSTACRAILSGIARDNKQVLFEGNGYSAEWHAEAERRGLPNNKTTVDALPALSTAKAKSIFAKFGVLSERELAARVEIALGALRQGRQHRGQRGARHREDDDPARGDPLPRHALRGRSGVARRAVAVRPLRRSGRQAERRDRRARARSAWRRTRRRDVRDEARVFVNDVIPAQTGCARSPTRSRRSSPTICGRCPSTASCSSSTEPHAIGVIARRPWRLWFAFQSGG